MIDMQGERFNSVTTKIVQETYIFTADRDYLTARFAFFERQGHLFLWSAAQALEKYLKANIILTMGERIHKTHKLTQLKDFLSEKFPQRADIDISLPAEWKAAGISLWQFTSVDAFLEHMDTWGNPAVRYDQRGVSLTFQCLAFLDRLSHQLRQGLADTLVTDNRHVSASIQSRFFDLNLPFAPPEHIHPELQGLVLATQSVSTLEAALNGCYGPSQPYEVWATDFLALAKSDIQHMKRHK